MALEVGLEAVELLVHHRLDAGIGKALGRTDESIGAERVVGADDGNRLHADLGQMLHHALGFVLIARPDVEDVGVHRLVEDHRAGGRCDQRELGVRQDRKHRLRVRRSAAQEQRDHALVGQYFRVDDRELRIELVVHRDELDLLAVDAAAAFTASKYR